MAGLVARILGAFFRIALAAVIKDEGVGLYQMAYPVYSTLLAVSTAGIPTAISKLVSENLAYGNYRGAYKTFRVAQTMLALSGLVIFAFMLFGAEFWPCRSFRGMAAAKKLFFHENMQAVSP